MKLKLEKHKEEHKFQTHLVYTSIETKWYICSAPDLNAFFDIHWFLAPCMFCQYNGVIHRINAI